MLVSGHRWMKDAETDVCMRCGKKFGVLPGNRKHHCRYCGKIFCGNCAPDVPSGKERLCLTCKVPHIFSAQLIQRKLKGWSTSSGAFMYDGAVPEAILSFLDVKSKTALLQTCKTIQRNFHIPTMPYRRCPEDRFPQVRFEGTKAGSGGGGTVYSVSDPETHTLVAVKLVAKDQQWGYASWRRLLNEISIQKSAQHRNIARLYEAFQTPTHAVFSMQYGEGKSLRHAWENVRKHNGDIEAFGLYVVRETVRALEYLYKTHRVVHRDIKPDNVVLSGDFSTVMLIDFGLAERIESDTQTYCPCGTKGFASPENIAAVNRAESRFVATGTMMHESDIFSVGVVAYILLSGTKPFRSLGFREMHNQLTHGLTCSGPKWEAISLQTRQLVEWMLHRNHERRATPDDINSHSAMTNLDQRIKPLFEARRRYQEEEDRDVSKEFDLVQDASEIFGDQGRQKQFTPDA